MGRYGRPIKVLIVGSFELNGPEGLPTQAACKSIGRALAAANCQIIVGSDSPSNVDRYIVEGANEVAGRHEVWIYCPPVQHLDGSDDNPLPFHSEAKGLTNIEVRYHREQGPWTVSHTAAVRDADVVLLIGGRHFTELIAQIAPILGKPLLPLPLFGGAAQKVWASFERLYLPRMNNAERQALTIQWEGSSGAKTVELLKKLHDENPYGVAPASFRILSLSGGGIRGIFQAKYLADVEHQLGRPLRDCFQLIAGTSTGAIIALGIALGVKLERILSLFVNYGREIFPPGVRHRSKRLWDYTGKGARYNPEPLRRRLTETFQVMDANGTRDLQLRDCGPRVVIAAVTLDRYRKRIFTTGEDDDLFAADVALSSAAAPLFFPAFQPSGEKRTYLDGGLCANNPALVAVLEAHRRWDIRLDQIGVVSVGNGEVPEGQVATDFNRMRRAGMIQPVLDVMFATQSELADSATACLLKEDEGMRGHHRRMLRINADLKHLIDLDDAESAPEILLPVAEEKARETFDAFKRMIE